MPSSASKGPILVVCPSRGLGGGIERYVRVVEAALRRSGCDFTSAFLRSESSGAGLIGQLRFYAQLRKYARTHRGPWLVMHVRLLPVVALARRSFRGLHVFHYGQDIWGMAVQYRWWARRPGISHHTISSFSAGALLGTGRATILAPPVEPTLAELIETQLESHRDNDSNTKPAIASILSVFRLGAFETKGGRELVAAVAMLRQEGHDVRLTIAGSGSATTHASSRRSWITIVENPSDAALAQLYCEADVFALLTAVTDERGCSHGEGFGQVCVEAQLAGTPVLVRGVGGQRDTIVRGVTGWTVDDDQPRSVSDGLLKAFEIGQATGRREIARLATQQFQVAAQDVLYSFAQQLGSG